MSMEASVSKLSYWIKERESIRIKKEDGYPKPWTQDPILQSYRFCNVHREHDLVTRWIRNHWSQGEHPNFVLAMALARFINWPDTLREVGFPFDWDPERVKTTLRDREKRSQQIWTSAYIVSTNGRAMPKIDYVVDLVLAPLAKAHLVIGPKATLANTHEKLRAFQGVGTFMSGQIIADLKNTKTHCLNDAPDFYSWCTPGPGSRRGLNRVLGKIKEAPVKEEDFLREVGVIQNMVADQTNMVIDAQDMQNCLCEFDKYMRVKNVEGRPRQSYPGV